MSKPKSRQVQPLFTEAAEIKVPSKAAVLEDFVFQVSLYPGRSGHTQLFKRKVVVTGAGLIKQMLAARKPIEIIE